SRPTFTADSFCIPRLNRTRMLSKSKLSRRNGLSKWRSQSSSRTRHRLNPGGTESRCLLLDRKTRRFFVSTISEVRNWLMLRGALFANGNAQWWRLRRRLSASSAVEELFQWLDSQPIPTISGQYLKAWEARFSAKRAIEGCVAAAFRLGFKGNEVREM